MGKKELYWSNSVVTDNPLWRNSDLVELFNPYLPPTEIRSYFTAVLASFIYYMTEPTVSSGKLDDMFSTLPLPPCLIPSTINTTKLPGCDQKKDHSSPCSISMLDNNVPFQGSSMSLKQPLRSPGDSRCIMSPTDLPLRSNSPSLLMKDIYMRQFLCEKAEKCL